MRGLKSFTINKYRAFEPVPNSQINGISMKGDVTGSGYGALSEGS